MVCCFAVVRYDCQHQSLIKVGCTKDCADFCEPRETLMVTKSLFACESCTEAAGNPARHERTATYSKKVRGIVERTAAIEDKQQRASIRTFALEAASAHHHWLTERASDNLAARVREAQQAERWTHNYADNIYQLKYEECTDWDDYQDDMHNMKDLKSWDLRILYEANWDSDYPDSSSERMSTMDDNNNAEATEPMDLSPESPARQLMPPPPRPARDRSPVTRGWSPPLSPGQMPSPELLAQEDSPEMELPMTPTSP